jgi:hypothetical protein
MQQARENQQTLTDSVAQTLGKLKGAFDQGFQEGVEEAKE